MGFKNYKQDSVHWDQTDDLKTRTTITRPTYSVICSCWMKRKHKSDLFVDQAVNTSQGLPHSTKLKEKKNTNNQRGFVQINHRVYKLILVGLFHSLLRGRCSGIITQHASCNTQWWWRKGGGSGNSGEPGGTGPSAPPLDLWVFLLLAWRQNSLKKESHNSIQLRVFKIYYSKNYSNYFRRSIGNSACLLR